MKEKTLDVSWLNPVRTDWRETVPACEKWEMNSSHGFKGENPKSSVVLNTAKYWQGLFWEMLASVSLKSFLTSFVRKA